jgi:hypothetical protein
MKAQRRVLPSDDLVYSRNAESCLCVCTTRWAWSQQVYSSRFRVPCHFRCWRRC